MNAAIAARLRDLLERRFADVAKQFEEHRQALLMGVAHLTGPELSFALHYYREAFQADPHLQGVWEMARRELHNAKPTGRWARTAGQDQRFERGWEILEEFHRRPDLFPQRIEAIRRFHGWVLDQLAAGVVVTAIVERYARGVERFEREPYRALLKRKKGDQSSRDERRAVLAMAAWLHAQGLDPQPEVQLGNGRADLVTRGGPDTVALEAKVVRSGDAEAVIRDRLAGGLAQARRYATNLSLTTGYLVVFWLSDDFQLDHQREHIIGDVVVRVVLVHLMMKSPSQLGGVPFVTLPPPVAGTPNVPTP